MVSFSTAKLFSQVLINRTWVTIRQGLVARLAELELLAGSEVAELLPGYTLPEPWTASEESSLVSLVWPIKESS
jgi:hypothetical protein